MKSMKIVKEYEIKESKKTEPCYKCSFYTEEFGCTNSEFQENELTCIEEIGEFGYFTEKHFTKEEKHKKIKTGSLDEILSYFRKSGAIFDAEVETDFGTYYLKTDKDYLLENIKREEIKEIYFDTKKDELKITLKNEKSITLKIKNLEDKLN